MLNEDGRVGKLTMVTQTGLDGRQGVEQVGRGWRWAEHEQRARSTVVGWAIGAGGWRQGWCIVM